MNWNTMTLNVHLPNSSFARDSLKKEFYQLPYDGQQTIGDFLGTDFNRWRRIEEIINEDISIGQYYLTDGGLEFSAQMKIGSKVLSLLIPEAKPVKLIVPMLCPCCGQEWPKDKPVPPGLELIPKEVESIEYTGIIIDCRGFK